MAFANLKLRISKEVAMLNVYFLLYVSFVSGMLWKNGIVHYNINNKDYDAHSRDIILSTLSQLQEAICIKFFQTSSSVNVTENERILYISNPDKLKNCPQNIYNFNKIVVDMPVGYKCLNKKNIARIVLDMLSASIDPNGTSSYKLIKRFEEREPDVSKSSLVSSWERNFINSHYKSECGLISSPMLPKVQRRSDQDSLQISEANLDYYRDKLWPLAIVLYGIEEELKSTPNYNVLKEAMAAIEESSCVVFQEVVLDGVLLPKSLVWFASQGEDMPQFGFYQGKQILKLSSMAHGAPGHTAHTINNLLRILSMPMVSNRYDRDNHVIINWRNVEMGKEQYLEKSPEAAWVGQIAYDFDSVTHAPANYMCGRCELGDTTVRPIQDHLWRRTLSMGHTTVLSDTDKQLLNILYKKECSSRYMAND